MATIRPQADAGTVAASPLVPLYVSFKHSIRKLVAFKLVCVGGSVEDECPSNVQSWVLDLT